MSTWHTILTVRLHFYITTRRSEAARGSRGTVASEPEASERAPPPQAHLERGGPVSATGALAVLEALLREQVPAALERVLARELAPAAVRRLFWEVLSACRMRC